MTSQDDGHPPPPTIAIGHLCDPNDLETHLAVSIIKFAIKERELTLH